MKRKTSGWASQTPPVLALVALLLTLGVVATTPFAWAKYAASATVSASATVATFDFDWVENHLNLPNATTPQPVIGCTNGGIIIYPSNWTSDIPIAWTLDNKSEVAVTVKTVADQVQLKMVTAYPASDDTAKIGKFQYSDGRDNLDMTVGSFDSPTPSSTPSILSPLTYGMPIGAAGDISKLKFQVTIKGYKNAPGTTRTFQNVVGGVSIDLADEEDPLWRTYRANADIIVTQVD